MRKIVGSEYLPSMKCLSDLIHDRFGTVNAFVSAFNESETSPNVRISSSLVNSWLCGRRSVRSSSAEVVFKAAGLLSGDCLEDHYHVLCMLMFGSCVPVYEDDPKSLYAILHDLVDSED